MGKMVEWKMVPSILAIFRNLHFRQLGILENWQPFLHLTCTLREPPGYLGTTTKKEDGAEVAWGVRQTTR